MSPGKLKKQLSSTTSGPNDPVEKSLRRYVDDFVKSNRAARVVANGLRVIGIGFWPIVDHLTFRTLNVEERAKEFLGMGYSYDEKLGMIEYENWWGKVYRKANYPSVFIDQAFEGERGKDCPIRKWVEAFGDRCVHHIALQVEDIENAVFYLEKQNVAFEGEIVGDKNTDLRQIYSKSELRDGQPFSVLELIERHRSYAGFLSP